MDKPLYFSGLHRQGKLRPQSPNSTSKMAFAGAKKKKLVLLVRHFVHTKKFKILASTRKHAVEEADARARHVIKVLTREHGYCSV